MPLFWRNLGNNLNFYDNYNSYNFLILCGRSTRNLIPENSCVSSTKDQNWLISHTTFWHIVGQNKWFNIISFSYLTYITMSQLNIGNWAIRTIGLIKILPRTISRLYREVDSFYSLHIRYTRNLVSEKSIYNIWCSNSWC